MNAVVRFLAGYARPNVRQYALGALMLVATNWVVVRIPAIIGQALNTLESTGADALADSRGLAGELALLGAIVIVVRTLSRVLFFNPGREIEYRLGLDLFAHLLTLQRPFFARRKIGELVSIASNDTMAVRLLIGFAGLQVCNVAVAMPLHLYQMWSTDPALTVWCLIPVAFGTAYMRWSVRRFFALVRQSMAMLAKLSDRVLESYSGIGTIRSHSAEAAAIGRFDQRNREYLRLQLRVSAIRAFGMPVLGFSGLIGTGVVVWVGGNRVIAGAIQVGDMATFTALLISLVSILSSLAWVLAAVSRGVVSLGRIDEVLRTPDGLPPMPDRRKITRPPRLELVDLGFTYPDGDKPALAGINAVVEPGHTLGIFGKTGSGKTTLVDLLARVHTPPHGTMLIDGRDVVDIDLATYRDGLAVVPQSAFLFSDSLRQNVALTDGMGPALLASMSGHALALDLPEDRRLEAVLDSACLRDDLRALPNGLDTVVGERGVMLSGGQRQRAALARALYRQRPVLILDDVLSAVDQGTEVRMVEAIRSIRGEGHGTAPTTVIVSHRTSVLEHADEILVLDHGRVIERGTHAELVARGGEYAETHLHQAHGETGGQS